MTYYLDSNCIRMLEAYYPDRFPSFWTNFDAAAARGEIASVYEVYKEIRNGSPSPHILAWAELHKSSFFLPPSEREMQKVAQIFTVPKFQEMIGKKQLLTGTAVADPFLVAAAFVNSGCVVTQEKSKPNSAKIPSVCQHYEVPCTDLQGMLAGLRWTF